jgi:glycosyltransferase involved in cell wall biosynthesis
MTKISIITINKNNNIGLKLTINSVISQIKSDIEYIVIDGKSTDGSVEVLHEYSNEIACWKSELDSGIYNAMNKGALLSKGDYLLYLNSGDVLYSENTLNVLCDSISQLPDSDLISGDLQLVNLDGNHQIYSSTEKVDLLFVLERYISHPSTLIKRDFFFQNGAYDESFKIVGDYAFFYSAIQRGSYSKIDLIISTHYMDGVSNSKTHSLNHQVERLKAIEKYTPDIYLTIIHEYLRLKKYDSLISVISYLGDILRKIGLLLKNK